MNARQTHADRASLFTAFGIGALPPEVYQRVQPALQPGASLEQVHEAARALAEECPLTCLQGVFFALICMGNPNVTPPN